MPSTLIGGSGDTKKRHLEFEKKRFLDHELHELKNRKGVKTVRRGLYQNYGGGEAEKRPRRLAARFGTVPSDIDLRN